MQFIPVPCRKCPPCLAKRSNGWIFRLLQQDKVSDTSLFVTLTYSNEHFTKESGRLTPKGYMTLNKRDFQLFMKRLRKATPKGVVLKYFAVGEYGSQTYRPHYHAIIFNAARTAIEKSWLLGNVHCDIVNGATVAYTTKYMHKGRLIPVHQHDDRLPEFQLISKGLGLNYINDDTIAYHRADLSRNYLVVEGGAKVPMPAIYRQKIFTDAQRKQQSRAIQELITEIEDTKKSEYKSIYGSLDGYYRSQVESKHASINSFRERQRSRNKI